MRLRHILIVAISFGSCKQEKSKITFFKTRDIIVVDTTIEATKFLQFDNYNIDYPIYYTGAKVDTIKIGKRYSRSKTQWRSDFSNSWSRKYSDKTLCIFVDTALKTNSPVEYFSDNPKMAYDSTVNYCSFLFSIENISDSTVNLGRTFSVFFIHREAKNENGTWIKIDKKLSELDICKTGEPTIFLKPQELLISKMKRYKGSFVTDFRLVFGYGNNIVYSNIFRDSIDKRTFQKASGTQ